jgi:hypothetical protein
MATCTAITSGDDNVAGTWSGGLIPSTTFAGTRTTSAGPTAIGSTAIPVAVGVQAVTAGKWLQIAGEYYKVATGLATLVAGNIIIDSPGLRVAVANGATVTVDMTDDQVVIPHPGTNSLGAGTQYTTNSAGYAIGATSITLITGTGTILVGECVQFGTDPAYYKVATSLTAGVLVLAAPGLTTAIPAAPTAVINAGYVVNWVSTNKPAGNDTFNISTLLSNAIAVSGTLKFAATGNPSIICRGTIFLDPLGGTLDLGPSTSPTASGVTRTIALNDSATMSTGKHGITISNTFAGSFRFMANGINIKRNAKLTATATAGQNQITVDDSTGWAIGDPVVIVSDTNNPARKLRTTITGGSHPTWTLAANVNFTRAVGTYVCNFGGNVVLKAYNEQFPAFINLVRVSASCKIVPDITRGVRCENIGSTAVSGVTYTGLSVISATDVVVSGIGLEWTGSGVSSATNALSVSGGNAGSITLSNICINAPSTPQSVALTAGGGVEGLATDVVICDSGFSFTSVSGGAKDFTFSGSAWGSFCSISSSAGVAKASGAYLASAGGAGIAALTPSTGNISVSNCTIDSPVRLIASGSFSSYKMDAQNVTLLNGALSGSYTTGSIQGQDAGVLINTLNGNPNDCRDNNYWRLCTTDGATRLRSTYSVKISISVANNAAIYRFKIPAITGIAQVVRGSLRFDAAYGTATPPKIVLSGQGVTQSYTCTATAGAWFDFSFSFTPTTTGDITATVTVQSTSTAGYAWLDGLVHYPMIQASRHWGYLPAVTAALTADSRMTLTEAAALALPVAINHGTSTVTVTGAVTPSECLQAMLADLYQTANNALAIHCSGDGTTFATTYTIVGGAYISGPYTDAVGTSGYLTLSGLTSGQSVVAIFDGTGALYSRTVASASTFGLSLPSGNTGLWAWKVVRYGYQTQTGTFAPNVGTVGSVVPSIPDTGITQATVATVAAYTSLDNPDRMYDYAAYYETTLAGIVSARIASKSGSSCSFGTVALTLDATAGAMITLGSGTVTLKAGAVVAGVTMTELTATGALLSLLHGATVSMIYTDSAGRHVNIVTPSLIAGTEVQLWDVVGGYEELAPTSVTGVLTHSMVWTVDETIRIRAMQCGATSATKFVESLGTLTSAGLSFLFTQETDPVYVANAIDGSSVTGITIDDSLMLFELTGRTTITWGEIYAYESYWLSTAAGIRDDGRIIEAIDPANYKLQGFKLKNLGPDPLTITGGWGRDSVTGRTADIIDMTGYPIFASPDAVVAYGQAAATPAEIWTYTSRTLTGNVAADVRAVNGTTIKGSGVTGDTWGPV